MMNDMIEGNAHELVLPDLGINDQPITAGMWLVEQGSRVVEGEQLLEVLAGSAVVDLPSPAGGVLVEILVSEDDPLQTGDRLAVIRCDRHDQ